MDVFTGTDNIITSLGFTTAENFSSMLDSRIGIKTWDDKAIFPQPVAFSRVDTNRLNHLFLDYSEQSKGKFTAGSFTRLEKMLILSIHDAMQRSGVDIKDPRTVFILSTTKGNIDLLEKAGEPHRLYLWKLAELICDHFGHPNKPVVVSNACISGSMAIITGMRMIKAGLYDHAIITGGDIISEFVVSGFYSFQALSPKPCRPFDASRDGLSLGEGCGTLILTNDPARSGSEEWIVVSGGGSSNDANHISGPSRDGEGLYLAIRAAMKEAGIESGDIDYISAHGTATPYNDEMEARALVWAGLESAPLNSFKGYFGHTLGAAGVIESILAVHSMKKNTLIRSAGYHTHGITPNVNVIRKKIEKKIAHCLKTASGFGGCNAAIIFNKF